MKILVLILLLVGLGCSHVDKVEKQYVRENIRSEISLNSSRFQACYKDSLKKKKDLSGKVVLRWTIVEGGRVDSVQVGESSLSHSDLELEDCLVREMKKVKFSSPPNDQEVAVSFPFIFKEG